MTTYKQKFRNLMQISIDAAKDKFMRDGKLPLVTWLIEDKNDVRIVLAFAPDISKADMLSKMREIAADKDIVRYTVETEAWTAVGSDGRMPSERPDRMEAIVVFGQDRQDNKSCVMIEIERKGDKHYLGETITTENASGEFQLFREAGA